MDHALGPLWPAAAAGGALLLGLIALLGLARRFLHICPPNEVLIFSGRTYTLTDGTKRGYRVVFGGRGWRTPYLESVDRMRLDLLEVPIAVRNAYSKGGIPLKVEAIANIKVSSDRTRIGNAIERFLGRNPEEIARVAKETLEGHLRGVLATLTPEEVNEDRLKFAAELRRESEEDLHKLGIDLEVFKIQHVTDDVNYLGSIGREAIANVLRDAAMAESDAQREAQQAEAEASARAAVTTANVDANIARMQNELRRIKAELESEVKSEEERTAAAAREARAVAEQELQQVRAVLEQIRLQADTVLPAEAGRSAELLRARGEAAVIRERGRAAGEALGALRGAWSEAGENALAIYLIEELEKILGAAAAGVSRVRIEHLQMIDAGDGQVLPSYVAAYPAMLAAIFDAVAQTTGIDVRRAVAGAPRTGG
jgi:flotillin